MAVRFVIAAALCASVQATIAMAAEPAASPTLTLEQAQNTALKNYPNVKISSLDIDEAQQAIIGVRSGYFPQVSGSAVRAFAEPATRIGSIGGLTDPTILDRGSLGVGVSQMITDFGKTDSLVKASRERLASEIARGRLTNQTVLLAVTEAYFEALRSAALLKVANSTFSQRETLLNQITSLAQAQLRSNLDVSIAKQDLDDARQLLLEADNRQADAMASLSETLGYSEVHPFSLADVGAIPPMSQELDASLATASAQNPELTSLAATRDAASAEADAAARAFYPTISALADAGANPISTPDQKINPNYKTAGIVLTIPLFTGGSLTAQRREALDKAGAASLALEAKRNQLLRDVHIAFDRLQTAYSNIEVSQRLVDNASDVLRLTQARYDIGSSSIVDLSSAQLRKTQADIAHTDAIYEYLIRRAALDYVTGTIAPNGSP